MYYPYIPCTDCPRKVPCDKCGYKNLQINYKRALEKIVELKPELIILK